MNLPFPISASVQIASTLLAGAAGFRTWVYRTGLRGRKRLGGKVVSIGNIGWGGTGKTPFTLWLAKRLSDAGLRPSILTRGYGRSSTNPVRVLAPGASAEDTRTEGDEVQLYLRHSVNVPIGIGACRRDAGSAIESQFDVDVHLLDDGFQHLPLARDLDIVLIDAQNPWGTRWGIPGVLRESPKALGRAHAILITNCKLHAGGSRERIEGLTKEIRRYNSDAPQFLASTSVTRFVGWKGTDSLLPAELAGRGALAFCGLGSPDNFFAVLDSAGVNLLGQVRFHDHHSYRTEDLKGLEERAHRLGAECVLTTEKDLVNLPSEARLTVPLYWTETRFVVEEGDRLLDWLIRELRIDARPQSKTVHSSPASMAR
jgi:tetraacyldisaccharide 4'-kinase